MQKFIQMLENSKSTRKILNFLGDNLYVVCYVWKNIFGAYKITILQLTSQGCIH
jgi:hypothetical protein